MPLAAAPYVIREVRGAAEVDEAYAVLDAWFGARAELERREVVDAWLAREDDTRAGVFRMRYHLLAAWAGDGSLAAVRDCHVTVDPRRGTCVIYLAHVYVMQDHRRTGLAQLLREVPLELARRDIAQWGLSESEILFAAEQEFYDRGAPDTAIRLVAYGRTGYQAISPSVLPYAQADFSNLAEGGVAKPLPLLAVVRRLGHEAESTLPAALAAAYVEHLYAVFATHCRAQDLLQPKRHALHVLAANSWSEVPLLRLPTSLEDQAALDRLSLASAMPYFDAR